MSEMLLGISRGTRQATNITAAYAGRRLLWERVAAGVCGDCLALRKTALVNVPSKGTSASVSTPLPASLADTLSPFMAAKAAFAWKATVWFRRCLLLIASAEWQANIAPSRQKFHLPSYPNLLDRLRSA